MKSPDSSLIVYMSLMDSIIRDCYSGTIGLPFLSVKDLDRDLSTLRKRVSNEGLHFLTDILPSMGKAIDRALETKRLSPVFGFKTKYGTNLPCFMHGKFRRVFHSNGILLDDPDPYSIQELRQVFFFFYKLELSFDEKKEQESLNKFNQAESDLSEFSFGHCDERIVRTAQNLLSRLLSGLDLGDIKPGHGPGSVNTGEKGNEKWEFKRLYDSLHQCYPYYNYFTVCSREGILDRISWYKSLQRLPNSTSKVCLVPKDSRGPRVISIEPLEVQYIQQGQMRKLVSRTERHPLTKGFVNFTDQSVNCKLALESSKTREYATLDLKEASDRVHCNLVRILFPDEITRYLFASRSQGTVLPNGSYLPFRKFAPMGSATCFPVLALSVWSLIRAYLDVNRLHGECFVYGDDVIVPTEHARGVSELLEAFAFKVNSDKSYVDGFFRESCGVDAYLGINITPLRMRRPWSGKSTDYSLFAHLTSLMERMFLRGFWRTSSSIQVLITSLFRRIPYGTATSGYPCISVGAADLAERLNKSHGIRYRWNSDLQRFEFLVRTDKSDTDDSPISGWSRMLKGLLSRPYRDTSVVAFRRVRKPVWRWMAV